MSGGYRTFVSVQEAAELLGVSGVSVRKLIESGKLAISGVKIHKTTMIDLSTIDEAKKHLNRKKDQQEVQCS